MNHLVAIPFLLPAVTACALVALSGRPALQRALSVTSALVLCLAVLRLALQVRGGVVEVYAYGAWPAHLGIVFVADRLAALMLVVAAAVALPALFHACGGADRQGRHFHALFHFQWMGLNGAFLTGDLFNLFVCFELMLIASYALLQHGGGAQRLKAGMQYVTVNLVASALFLIAASLIYRAGGTLNMADLAVRLGDAGSDDLPWIRAGVWLLAVVFLLKGAAAPLYLWLPGTYGAATGPVAALFAVLTKVGPYALLRVTGTAFPSVDAGGILLEVVLVAGLITAVVAALGAISARTLTALAAWLGLGSSASMLVAVGLFNETATGGGLFYVLPGTLGVAAMLLLADSIRAARGDAGDELTRAPRMRDHAVLGALYFGIAVAVAGMPPFAGFLGKAMLLSGTPTVFPVWPVILGASLVNMIALARAGSRLFWAVDPDLAGGSARHVHPVAPALLLAFILIATAGAGRLESFARGAAEGAIGPARYIAEVLGPERLRWMIRIDPSSTEGGR